MSGLHRGTWGGGTQMGEGVEILGYVGHYRSLIRSDITNILNIKKRLIIRSGYREGEGQ